MASGLIVCMEYGIDIENHLSQQRLFSRKGMVIRGLMIVIQEIALNRINHQMPLVLKTSYTPSLQAQTDMVVSLPNQGIPRNQSLKTYTHLFQNYIHNGPILISLPPQKLIHTKVPNKPLSTPAVRIPAPALSPVVTFLVSICGNGPDESELPGFPAPGLLWLVPP